MAYLTLAQFCSQQQHSSILGLLKPEGKISEWKVGVITPQNPANGCYGVGLLPDKADNLPYLSKLKQWQDIARLLEPVKFVHPSPVTQTFLDCEFKPSNDGKFALTKTEYNYEIVDRVVEDGLDLTPDLFFLGQVVICKPIISGQFKSVSTVIKIDTLIYSFCEHLAEHEYFCIQELISDEENLKLHKPFTRYDELNTDDWQIPNYEMQKLGVIGVVNGGHLFLKKLSVYSGRGTAVWRTLKEVKSNCGEDPFLDPMLEKAVRLIYGNARQRCERAMNLLMRVPTKTPNQVLPRPVKAAQRPPGRLVPKARSATPASVSNRHSNQTLALLRPPKPKAQAEELVTV